MGAGAGPRIDSAILAQPEIIDTGKKGALLNGDMGGVISSFYCNGLPWYGEIFEGEKFVICECLEYSNVKISLYDGRTGAVAELYSNGGYYAENAILSKFGGMAATSDFLTGHARTYYNYTNLKWERPSDEAILFNRETGAETALGDMQQLIGIILKSWKLPILR